VCPGCGDPVLDSYVKRLREKGRLDFNCPCGGTVSLAEPKERIPFRSKVEAMEQSADGHRDFDAFVMSAKGRRSMRVFANHETHGTHEPGSRGTVSVGVRFPRAP
jgi:hypothetical protein